MSVHTLRCGAAALVLSSVLIAAGSSSNIAYANDHGIIRSTPSAVVFRWDGGSVHYIGVASCPTNLDSPFDLRFHDSASGVLSPRSHHGFIIWFEQPGKARGIRYDTAAHQWSDVNNGTWRALSKRDEALLRSLIARARPAVERPLPASPVGGEAVYQSPLPTLADLCRASQIIAVCQVAGVLYTAHSPENSPYPEQHSVVLLAVERCLKCPDPNRPPQVIKFHENGGGLPSADALPPAFWTAEDPPLIPGARYLLFLTSVNVDHLFDKLGYVSVRYHGITGKVADLDEYMASQIWQGKVLLASDFTRAPAPSPDLGQEHWRFMYDPQILDLPESTAIEVVENQLRKLQLNPSWMPEEGANSHSR